MTSSTTFANLSALSVEGNNLHNTVLQNSTCIKGRPEWISGRDSQVRSLNNSKQWRYWYNNLTRQVLWLLNACTTLKSALWEPRTTVKSTMHISLIDCMNHDIACQVVNSWLSQFILQSNEAWKAHSTQNFKSFFLSETNMIEEHSKTLRD